VRESAGHHIFFLLPTAPGLLLGLITLWHNRIGNFKVYPEIKAGSKLITTGPYRYIRHPMYTSLLLCIAGGALYLNHWLNYLGLLVVMVAVILKAKKEEKLLSARHPGYKNYMRKTSGFIPRPGKSFKASSG
jgi:protein-S-isoprenylcysteine O-methyltransferase Ste14